MLSTLQLWSQETWNIKVLTGRGPMGGPKKEFVSLCLLASGGCQHSLVSNLYFYFLGQRHTVFKSPQSHLFLLAMTFLIPGPFLLSPPRQPKVIYHLRILNYICSHISSCLHIRVWTSLEGPSLSSADALTISCSLGTGTGISWKWSLCLHSYELTNLLSQPSDLLFSHFSHYFEAFHI